MRAAEDIKHHYLYPSNLYIGTESDIISTVLGSCVAVCLFDPKQGIGGMNHYMLPFWNGDGLASAKYGNIAIEKLIAELEKKNSLKHNMIAKVFGGANQANFSMRIGDRNVEVAKEILKSKGIKILAENTGGVKGRKLIFDTKTGIVKMKFLNPVSPNL